jgi:hypothetical protein
MIQLFGGFFVSLVQQQLSGELVLVINPKSVDLVCRNLMTEAEISTANNLICAEEACYILKEIEGLAS